MGKYIYSRWFWHCWRKIRVNYGLLYWTDGYFAHSMFHLLEICFRIVQWAGKMRRVFHEPSNRPSPRSRTTSGPLWCDDNMWISPASVLHVRGLCVSPNYIDLLVINDTNCGPQRATSPCQFSLNAFNVRLRESPLKTRVPHPVATVHHSTSSSIYLSN